jgi:hypothetical protein
MHLNLVRAAHLAANEWGSHHLRHERTLRRAHSPGSAATCAADDEGSADTDPFVRGIRLAWWSTGPRCGPTDDSSAPCWSVYAEDRLTRRLTPCGN